jgi:hypothetical protein
MPLNAVKHGERAEFSDDFYGSPTVVERRKFDEHEDGCIAYTRDPIPTNTAWRIELLKTTECWQRGLTIGLTTALPEKLPPTLPLIKTKKDFNYEIRYMAAESEAGDMRSRAGTSARNLPLLWDAAISKSLCLYLTPNGELHIYFDGKHIKKIESGLPVDVPLWGAVDVSGRCVQIKSQLLLKPLEGEAATPTTLHHADDVALPPMDCFKNKAEKVEVPPSEKTVTVVPRGIGAVLKVPPKATTEGDRPLTFAFTTCTPQSFAYAAGYKSLSPISYIASNKPLGEEVEVLLEHSVNIESIEQAGDMVFCHANLPEDGSSEIQFSPLQGGEFEVGKPRGRLKTDELGFFCSRNKGS